MAEKTVRKKVTKSANTVRRKKTSNKVATSAATKRPMSRKAPTPIAQTNARSSKKQKMLLISAFVFMCVVGVSVAIGFSDGGSISVSDVVTERKQNASAEEQGELDSVSKKSERAIVPYGGLVPSGKPAPSAPAPQETNASSTDETASSTDDGGEEVTTDTAEEGTEAEGEEAVE